MAETIARLAGLPPIEYDRFREKEAKRLGVRVGTLDAEVVRLRPQSESGAEAGAAVLFDEVEPWPDPVNGAELLDAIADTFTRYLVLPAGASHALALWTAHTHVFDAFEHTPRLNVTAPQKQCGKTLLQACYCWRTSKAVSLSRGACGYDAGRDHPRHSPPRRHANRRPSRPGVDRAASATR